MSDSNYIKQWTVNDDGTLNPVSISSYSDLSDSNVFIVVDENARKIFIWKGEKAPVRRKFISAKAAQQMRQEQYGMVYRIESLDPGLEGSDFLSIFGETPSTRDAASPVTTEEEVYTRPVSAPTPQRAPATVPKRAPAAEPQRAPTAAPKPAPTAAAASTQVTRPTTPPARVKTPPTPSPKVVKETEVVVTEPVKPTVTRSLEEVSAKLKELEIPINLEREIVIIESTVFSVIKEHLALFSKDVVKLEPMDDLPSGIFPASDYQVRLFIEDGKILFIELLREKTRSERDEFVDDMKKSLQDLSKMGI